MTSWRLEKTRSTFARLTRWSLARWERASSNSFKKVVESNLLKHCHPPPDLFRVLGGRHHSDRVPAHILQGKFSLVLFFNPSLFNPVTLQSCIVKHLEDNINCPECEVTWTVKVFVPTKLANAGDDPPVPPPRLHRLWPHDARYRLQAGIWNIFELNWIPS